MSHGRPTRRPRYRPRIDNLSLALCRAARLMPHEIDEALHLVRPALAALRQGVATELQWSALASAIEVALAIEDQRVVKGLREHLKSAELAMSEISKRAMATGTWCQVELHLQELDDVAEGIRLYEFQLEQLSAGELARAVATARTRVCQAGGLVIDAHELQGELL